METRTFSIGLTFLARKVLVSFLEWSEQEYYATNVGSTT